MLGLSILMSPGNVARSDPLDERSSQTINSWLATTLEQAPTKVRPQKVEPITYVHLQDVFPDDRFYAISFATWPRPPSLPKELSPQMVVRVPGRDSVQPIRNVDDLTNFLGAALPEARGDERIRAVVLASLRLAEAVAKAGAYEFGNPDVSVARGDLRIEATASASVAEPARGAVTIRMQFAPDGAVLPDGIRIEDRTNPGPPPRR
ncbi:hypothetical protein ACVWXM_005165 [Bradyrhizobium sp. GM7.3]